MVFGLNKWQSTPCLSMGVGSGILLIFPKRGRVLHFAIFQEVIKLHH